MNQLIKILVTFPCIDKKPKIKNWNELKEKIEHNENENYGILCGEINDIIVIDLDKVKESEDKEKNLCGLEAWEVLKNKYKKEFKNLKIPTVETKSGGKHLYFKYTDKVKESGIQQLNCENFGVKDKKIKIDILSNKRYVIGPESKGYKFIEESRNFLPPEVPDFLIDILNDRKSKKIKSLEIKNNKKIKYIDLSNYNGESDDDNSSSEIEEKYIKMEEIIEDEDKSSSIEDIYSKTKNFIKSIDFNELKKIIDELGEEYADDYEYWRNIIWAIAQVSEENDYLEKGLELADSFSKKSKKYKGLDEVGALFDSNNGSFGFGTLKKYSKESKKNNFLNKENKLILVKDLKKIDDFSKTKDIEFLEEKKKKLLFNLIFKNNDIKKKISLGKENLSIHEILNKDEKKFVDFIINKMPFSQNLTDINKNIKGESICNLNKDKIEIFNKKGKILVEDAWKEKPFVLNFINGKEVGKKDRSKKTIEIIMHELAKQCQELFKERYNIHFTINNFNNCIFNGNQSDDEEKKESRNERKIIDDLIKADEKILNKYKVCNDLIYILNKKTNIWEIKKNSFLEDRLSEELLNKLELTKEEKKNAETQRNISYLRQMFMKKILDDEFEEKLDSNFDIFAMSNCCFDLEKKKIRKLKGKDYVSINSGWNYNKEESDKYINEVDDFFTKLFPIKEEKEIILIFLAELLHGHRLDKKFLVLTDKRNGNNGKSTLLKLIRVFFGSRYMKKSSKFICKPKFDKDKDSHDAGLGSMKGKRILLSDELKKYNELDVGLIKEIAGYDFDVDGRKLGKDEYFHFTWQAGLIIVFNEGDCPKFDSSDSAFMERMVVAPMRSKFILNPENSLNEYTYKLDENIKYKFKLWRSSLLDYFIPYCKKEGLLKINIPKDMKDWKSDIISENNELSEWLFSEIEITNNKEDYLSLGDLLKRYRNQVSKNILDHRFNLLIKPLLLNKGLDFKERFTRQKNGKRINKNNAFLGIKFKLFNKVDDDFEF